MTPISRRATISNGRICSVLISIKFAEIILVEITPAIIGGKVAGQWQCSLVLVEQDFEDRLAV
jgi:hypothetical protein